MPKGVIGVCLETNARQFWPCGKPLAAICIILFAMMVIELPSSSFGGLLFRIMSITPFVITVNKSAAFCTSNCQNKEKQMGIKLNANRN